jgi:hypothetical protein
VRTGVQHQVLFVASAVVACGDLHVLAPVID